MIVCIDTNVFIQASKAVHPLSKIFSGWLARRFQWAVSNDILTEYEEMLVQRSGRQRWLQFSRALDLAEKRGGMLVRANPSYRFQVVSADPDDNKFSDCAIAAEADYVITNDRHLKALAGSGYKPQPITPEDFIQKHLTGI